MDGGAEREARPSWTRLRHRTRGAVVRSLLDALRNRSMLDPVAERVSPATRVLLRTPPPALAWVPTRQFVELETAALLVRDVRTVRAIGRDIAERGALPLARPLIDAVLKALDATPTRVLAYANPILRLLNVGYALHTEAEQADGCTVHVLLPEGEGVTEASFHSLAGSLEFCFPLCHLRGEVSDPEVLSLERPEALLRMRWTR